MGRNIDWDQQPRILAKPVMVCDVCKEKMIVYKIRLHTGEIKVKTIHEHGVSDEQEKMVVASD